MAQDRTAYFKQYRQEYKTSRKRVTISYENKQYRKLKSEAKAANLKLTEYIRRRSLEGDLISASTYFDASREEIVSDLRRILMSVANNINQMAHHSNMLRRVLDVNEPLEELDRMVHQMTEFFKHVR